MEAQLLTLLGGEGATDDVVIRGVTNDSRVVGPGMLFAALPGTRFDGSEFVQDAVDKGAAAILMDAAANLDFSDVSVPVVTDKNPRRKYAELACRMAGAQPAHQVAVTGTNGKTSVAEFTRQIWQALGYDAASVGTLGVRSPSVQIEGGLTTPDPMKLHAVMAKLKLSGVDRVAVEASSHGLDQYRLDGTRLSAAAFTNLTRDHLDYHKTEQAYFYAKARLFGDLLAPGGLAVINIDTAWGKILDDLAWGRSLERLTYGYAEGASLRLVGVEPTALGQILTLEAAGEAMQLQLPLVGDFQALNALAAAALATQGGADLKSCLQAIEMLDGVPGRLELVGTLNGAGIYVDYAHTPDGLKTVLNATKAHNPTNLHVVFGCGGDRDTGKRPQMGRLAAELADFVYVTDDNPRSERPAAIRAEIMAACPDAYEIDDRASAIEAAIGNAGPGDMVIVAGKGHETGQIFANGTIEYSDIETVRALTQVPAPSSDQGG